MNKVFIYYYCDEWKSRDSMRIHRVFADTMKGREALANCIIADAEDGVIELDFPKANEIVNDMCVNKTPIYLNDYITYGHIESQTVEG
jgi:hypothetical protein